MPLFERRPTDIQKIGKAIMLGVCVAVPILMFGPNLIVSYGYSRLSVGDEVHIARGSEDGGGHAIVKEINDDSVVVKNVHTGETHTVPRNIVREL